MRHAASLGALLLLATVLHGAETTVGEEGLRAAIEAAGQVPTTLVIGRPVRVDTDLSVPDHIDLRFVRGGRLIVSRGAAVDIGGGLEAGLFPILGGEGRVTGDVRASTIHPEWFGAEGDEEGVGDWASAINRAIVLADQGCRRVQLQARRYNVKSTINLTHTSGAHGADVCLEGTVRSTQYQRGSLLVGNTGENKCVIETSDVDGVHLRNVGIVTGTERPSSIGLLQARGTERGWAGDQYHENLYIDMGSDPSANNGLGRVGIVNLAGEETRWHNLQVWANLPLVLTWSNGCQRTRGDLSGQDGYRFASSVGVEFVETASNTVLALTGLGRLIAYDYVSPCVLINAAGTVDLGHTFMQLRPSDAPGVTVGQYRYAVENWNAYQFRHFGAVEGAGGYLMNRRGLTEAEINVRLAATSEKSLPALYLFDDGGDYAITNSDVTLMSYDVERPLVLSRRLDGNVRAPMRFAISNCRFRCNMPLSPTTFPDGRVLARARDTDWFFGNRSLRAGEGSLSSGFAERLAAGAGPTELLRLQLPGPPGENEPFAGVLMAKAVLVDAVVGAQLEPTAETVSADFRVLRDGGGRVSASFLAGRGDAPEGGYSLDCVPDQDGGSVRVRLLHADPGRAERELLARGTVSVRWGGTPVWAPLLQWP